MRKLWNRFQTWRLLRRIDRLADWVAEVENDGGLTLEQQIALDKGCRELQAIMERPEQRREE